MEKNSESKTGIEETKVDKSGGKNFPLYSYWKEH